MKEILQDGRNYAQDAENWNHKDWWNFLKANRNRPIIVKTCYLFFWGDTQMSVFWQNSMSDSWKEN